MATRFYLPDTGTAPYVPSIMTGWEATGGVTAFPTDTIKTNTATNGGAARPKNSTVANDDRLDRIYITGRQLASQTIAVGTFSAVIRAIQSAATTDAWLQTMLRVVSADGTTQRGLIYAGSTAVTEVATVGNEAEEYGTVSSTRIKNAIATSAVTAQAGDRLQIEIGARINGTTTTDTFTHRYGDPSATGDFALTSGLTTDLCPWVELSQTLVFLPVPARVRVSNPAVVRAATR